jgi:hypothetical protein
MGRPSDSTQRKRRYWIRGPRTSRHIYFYPSDDRVGIALFALFGFLGLIAMGFGISPIVKAAEYQRQDVILVCVGVFVASIAIFQALRLWRDP